MASVERSRRWFLKAGTGLGLAGTSLAAGWPGLAGAARALAQTPAAGSDLDALAVEAWLYGYALLSIAVTARQATNVAAPSENRAPVNQIASRRTFPDASFTAVVAPNVDTLYSSAHLDLTAEPLVFQWPAFGQRYFLFPFLDAWSNVIVTPGSRTTDQGAGTLILAGPDWDGAVPAGIDLPPDAIGVRAPTPHAWFIGRIYSTGTQEDFAAVYALQDQLKFTPLSQWGKVSAASAGRVDPAIDMTTAPVAQVNAMDAATYFGQLATLMAANPPYPADAPLLAKLAALGIAPGKPFDLDPLDPAARQALMAAPKAGFERIVQEGPNALPSKNGWTLLLSGGDYGTDYLVRAFVALIGLGANRAEDAFYPNARVDSAGQPLDGANNYIVHFDAAPPVRGFWSLTAYTAERFLVPNPIDRFAIRGSDPIVKNPDGSFDLVVQPTSPGNEREANWLPVPAASFNLTLRLYWPDDAALDGSWPLPTIVRAK
ncbi:MAG TPA: DUF1254 domain-containing protein [Thermomicrobiales bacterium]|nr:DUF1254 domain-containing protein [Thermomicrobiales bacterium]